MFFNIHQVQKVKLKTNNGMMKILMPKTQAQTLQNYIFRIKSDYIDLLKKQISVLTFTLLFIYIR